MTRDTSAAAFAQLQFSTILGELQAKAYRLIKENPGKTANELRVLEEAARPGADHEYYESLDKRFSELERWAVVISKDKRACTISGKLCYTWWPTGRDPVKPPKRVKKEDQVALVRKLLRDIYWNTKQGLPVDLGWLEEESKKLLKTLETGFEQA